MAITRVFVCGATGNQGGAVARHLRAKNVEVHALARNPSSEKSKALESIGVKLWAGDYDNRGALADATKGCEAIFMNFMPDFKDLTAEARWCENILEAGKAAGAKHVVYSSGFRVDETDKLPFLSPQGLVATTLRSKASVENRVKGAGYESWAILRPGNFMANFFPPLVRMYPGLVEQGVWTSALRPETVLPMTDTETIGRFGSAAVLDPERFGGETVTYADELLSAGQVMELLSGAAGRHLTAVFLTDAEAEDQRGLNPFIEGQLCMREMARSVNIAQVKEWGIPLSTFKEFLQREKQQVDETYSKSS